ncbi:MAG: hypothetical protein A3E85_00265 [Gammaproteobacteria bacterium RIFCSPHIGHO2_12_FULL_45_12]|nr:MAG: hypothetical protein A3E85_00265 [Gammaproteobacteria bacterium RIFCSPHIGHO2_12_FULL_45_12]
MAEHYDLTVRQSILQFSLQRNAQERLMKLKKKQLRRLAFCLLSLLVTSKSMAAAPPSSLPIQPLLKQHLQVQVQNASEAKAVMTKQLIRCYQKIRRCEPGQFKYAIPDPIAVLAAASSTQSTSFSPLILGRYDIKGFKQGHCQVEDHYQMQRRDYIQTCQFQRQSLAAFTDQAAINTVSGILEHESHPSPLQKALLNECRTNLSPSRSS